MLRCAFVLLALSGGSALAAPLEAADVALSAGRYGDAEALCRRASAAHRSLWDGKAFAARLILPLSLSWDHRVVDGASAARFNAYLGALLGDFRRALL